MTYALGWPVILQILIRRERWPGGHKTKGTPLVERGRNVQPEQPVISLEKKEPIEALATASPETNTSANAGYNLRYDGTRKGSETIAAGLRGRVVDITRRGGVIIESYAAVLQGVMGAGGQVAGVLTMWQQPDARSGQVVMPPGALLVMPGPIDFAMLRKAMISGVVGMIASSISVRDLEAFLRTDVVMLINSVDGELAQISLPPMTILLTEGLGARVMPMRILNLLSHYQGSIALLTGATSVRQGVFPELVISLPENEVQQQWRPVQPDPTLTIGAQVRISSGDYEGAVGIIDYLFSHEQIFLSRVRARAAHVRLENGLMMTLPLTLLERIG
ncbi:MAG: hypothetical protein NVSMB33_09820 [Ktedonobacteraceae bacterium]